MKIKILLGGVALLLVSGCASMFACTTEANYNADGTWSYKSCKNQENFKAKIGKDFRGQPEAEISTSATTAESVTAAALQIQLQTLDILKTLVPLATKAAGVP